MLNKLPFKKIIVVITASVAVSTAIIGWRHQGSFEQIELLAYDSLVRLNAKSDWDERITIVGIDDDTLRKLNSDKISDGQLKQVLETIHKYQPRVIGVDIIRDIPIGEGREELLSYVNNLYQPLEASIKPIIFSCALPSKIRPKGIDPPPVIDADSAVGFVDLETDRPNIFGGEIIRRGLISSIPANIKSDIASNKQFDTQSSDYRCNAPFSFSFLTALSYIQAQRRETLSPDSSLNISEFLYINNIEKGEIRFKSLTLRPLQPRTGSYHNLDPSAYQHLVDYRYTQPGEIISLTEILDNLDSNVISQQFKDKFTDKVVLIGYTTKEDIHQTPLGLRPGVLVHGWMIGQLLSNVLDRQPQIWSWSEPVEWLWIIVWGVAGSIVALRIRPVKIFIGSQGIAIAILLGSCWFLFTQQGWIPLIPPCLSFVLSSILVKAIPSRFSTSLPVNLPTPSTTLPIEREPLVTVVERLVNTASPAEREPLITVVEKLINNASPIEREPLITVVDRLVNTASLAEREPLITVVEKLIDNASPTEKVPLVTVVERLVNTASPAEREPLITVVEKLIDNASPTEREPLITVVERLKKNDGRPLFIRPDPSIGKIIGDGDRYLLQKLLGKGGMSQVYLALDRKLNNKQVAIKIMTSYFSANDQYLRKRFEAEVRSLCNLNHPNIIQITDYGLTPEESPFSGYPFYVMEYFVGQTLQQLLNEKQTLALTLALNIVLKVCHGLKQAHKQGIIHRDLKPDNIFLISGGEVVKILDFGIAKKIDEESKEHTQLTMVNTFIGTYHYASPEQCQKISVDLRTDIYSLGMVLYQILSGNNPYNLTNDSNTTNADWDVAHRRKPPIPLREQPDCQNIPGEIENIVMKCLSKSPQKRFQSIEDLEQALIKYS